MIDDDSYYDNCKRTFQEPTWFGSYNNKPLDKDGKPVKRTKSEYPYSYDDFVVWRGGPNSSINNAVYSDRLRGWDSAKYDRLIRELKPAHGSRWDPLLTQAFLRAFMDDPGLQLILIMEGCNWSNGFPVWTFHYKEGS